MDKQEYAALQKNFFAYLLKQGKKKITAETERSDAFYLVRHDSSIDLHELLHSPDFEQLTYCHLNKVLQKKSKVEGKNISLYVHALRDLRDFVLLAQNASSLKTSAGYASNFSPSNIKETSVTANVSLDALKNTSLQRPKTKGKKSPPNAPVPRPSRSLLDEYLFRWMNTPQLYEPEKALEQVFRRSHPFNSAIGDILLKVAFLNTIYGTNIYSVYPVARHILSLGIDARLKAGDVTLVNELMRVKFDNGKEKTLYSFATKYCSFHNPTDFPIYDSIVDKVLCYYRDCEGFASFQKSDLKHYPTFKQIIEKFRTYFDLERYNLKQIDKFIWLFGKEYFR